MCGGGFANIERKTFELKAVSNYNISLFTTFVQQMSIQHRAIDALIDWAYSKKKNELCNDSPSDVEFPYHAHNVFSEYVIHEVTSSFVIYP